MKQCSSCGQTISDSATVCDSCSEWEASVAPPRPPAPAPDAPAASSPAPDASTKAAPVGRSYKRELVVTVSALIVVAFILLSFLSSRGTPSTAVATTASGVPSGAGPSAAAPVDPPVPTQKWTSDNSAYWVGNARKSKAFELPAENNVQVWTRSVRPTLLVRCMQGNLQVLVITESALKIEAQTSDHTVTYTFDGGATATEPWADSEEHDALFARDSRGFLERIVGARTLRVGYTPHNASPVVASFHVAGLAPLMEPFARECGRK